MVDPVEVVAYDGEGVRLAEVLERLEATAFGVQTLFGFRSLQRFAGVLRRG